MAKYKLVEKANHHHVHGHFDVLQSAQYHLSVNVPEYCKLGFYMDKTLTPESFEIIDPDGKVCPV